MDIKLIFSLIATIIFCGFLIRAAMGDVAKFTISNKLNIIFAVIFLLLAFPLGLNFQDLLSHIMVAIIVFIAGFALFSFGVFGGGDAKLMAATSLWLGPIPIIAYVVYTAFFGGIFALFLILLRTYSAKFGLPHRPRWFRQLARKKAQVPYGVALCIGGILALFQVPWFEPTLNLLK